jgi:hypothetical protein
MYDNNTCSKTTLKLFKDWNENGIKYCHWKSNEHLLEGLQGKTDLDVLICPLDSNKANMYLINNGFKRVISHKWKSYSAVEDWIGVDSQNLVQTHMHIHYRLLTGLKNVKEQYLPWDNLVLDNSVKHKKYDIYVCNPNIEIIMLICRIAIKKNLLDSLKGCRMSDTEKLEFNYLIERCSIDAVSKFAEQMLSMQAKNELLKIIQKFDYTVNLSSFRKIILKEFPMCQKITRTKATCIYAKRQIIYKLAKLFRCPIRLKKNIYTGGKLISFIGVDGAGKTTLAKDFEKWLSWKIDCRYVYLGTGDGKSSFLNRMKKKIVIKERREKSTKDVIKSINHCEPSVLSLKKQVKLIVRNYICYSNDKYKYKTICNIFKMVNDGCIVITDRYPQMQFEGIYDGMTIVSFKGNKLLSAINEIIMIKEHDLYEKMCSVNPDIVIKLDIPFEISIERKPCTGKALEQVKEKVEITKKLHYKGSHEYIINSVGEIDETKKEVCNLLWGLI